ncbi:hypothetical protein PMI14_03219 [Acidovorax sp. CF316]|uniref:restriction endonuclease n=1 Tax=Acidovorax sp. CF316 TaxID=1144317 RepID=UPI00026BDEDF|nr:restriction endonuclease [Acidovorax sp. CF316]EJE52108.1 hypothetical protein PMI14_03219 [Acidovorax sp. CF316]
MSSPLSPMLVQYLVGLCCLRWGSEAVDVTLGDYVLDSAAGKERDVDVTVRVNAGAEGVFAFMGYEVKKEALPLDVTVVEQLSAKLKDMEEITHRAIVSTSGYTEAARKKASAHGITLYELKRWTRPVNEQFPSFSETSVSIEHFFMTGRVSLYWVNWHMKVVCANRHKPFAINDTDAVLAKSGKAHKKFTSFGDLKNELYLRSTETLIQFDHVRAVMETFPIPNPVEGGWEGGPAWPYAHTLDVSGDAAHLKVDDEVLAIANITIAGQLQWQKHGERALYYVMEDVEAKSAFAGAIVFPELRAGEMKALIVSPRSREVDVRFVQLLEKQLNILKGVSLTREGEST